MLPTPYEAVSDYLRWRDGYGVYATVSGQNLLTREAVEGQKYRVIDPVNRETLLIEDGNGRAYTVSIRDTSNIHAAHIRVYREGPIVPSNYRLDLSGRLVRDLIDSLPRGALRVYVTAELKLKGYVELPTALGRYPRVEGSADSYQLRSATVGDLQGLAHLAIEQTNSRFKSFATGKI